MANKVLSWGEGKVKFGVSTGSETSAYTDFPDIVVNSLGLTTTPGTATEARKIGGKLVARRTSARTRVLTFDIFYAAGTTLPDISESQNYSVQFVPEKLQAPGFKMPYCSVEINEKWTEENGSMIGYTFTELEPDSGNGFEWVAGAVGLSTDTLSFIAAGESKTVTVSTPGSVSASSADSWLTVSVTGSTITATASSNSSTARATTITVTQGSNTATINVTQEAA